MEKRILAKGKFYQDLTTYISLLKENVYGRQLELSVFDNEFAKSSGKAFADYILSRRLSVKLSRLQKDNLTSFFDNLDCISSQALIEHINYYGKILAEDAQKVLQSDVVRSSICSKLGMLLGAMIGILFV